MLSNEVYWWLNVSFLPFFYESTNNRPPKSLKIFNQILANLGFALPLLFLAFLCSAHLVGPSLKCVCTFIRYLIGPFYASPNLTPAHATAQFLILARP